MESRTSMGTVVGVSVPWSVHARPRLGASLIARLCMVWRGSWASMLCTPRRDDAGGAAVFTCRRQTVVPLSLTPPSLTPPEGAASIAALPSVEDEFMVA